MRYFIIWLCFAPLLVQALEVNIAPDLESVDVMHNGKEVTIQRNQDTKNKIIDDFALTSRACPPFCIQPMKLEKGVETIAELEVLSYLDKSSWGDKNIVVIDSRTPNWLEKGTIPGSVNIPWTVFNLKNGANTIEISEVMIKEFGVRQIDDLLDFSEAKTLVLFCNGPWCGQSPISIKTLLSFGYPAAKIKWYRGGMQMWESYGFTTVKPEDTSK